MWSDFIFHHLRARPWGLRQAPNVGGGGRFCRWVGQVGRREPQLLYSSQTPTRGCELLTLRLWGGAD